jgi:hypothetical protein
MDKHYQIEQLFNEMIGDVKYIKLTTYFSSKNK